MKKEDKKLIWIGVGVVVVTALILGYVFRDKLKKMTKDTLGGQQWFDESLKWWRNEDTKSIVDKLHPQFRDKMAEFFAKVEKDLNIQLIATSGYRTIAKQAELYKENSSNSKPGYSLHNYGYALDVNAIDLKTGKVFLKKATSKADWEKSGIVKIAKDLGLSWGGDFKSYHDPVHFFINPKGLSTTALLALHNKGKVDANGYVIV